MPETRTYVVQCTADDDGRVTVRAIDGRSATRIDDAPIYTPGLWAHPFDSATDALAEAMPETFRDVFGFGPETTNTP